MKKAGDSALLKLGKLPASGEVTNWKRIRQGRTVVEEHDGKVVPPESSPVVVFPKEGELGIGHVKTSDFGVYWSPDLNPVDGKVVPPESSPVVVFPKDGELGIGPVKASDFGVYWSPDLNPVVSIAYSVC
ncbi:unnamed protein product [Strongylus vulgaris]|uniref:Uncharacterized protein n=1 Tax=Strongylus vulgaris TaxID=40348 RepID=A0A3P7JGH4_STRVU|nr:unnamed protein product [Strongylus vulgaris]